ncbi:chorismate mutase [Streptococcus sp. DD13]|uniref:chorismate mutase n=1 Tax=Streptococcus sp. DD13 TaxID=1777881 RepID=UPI00079653BB|nr:chorismate mutase [Streptococcus sp. DD13]KXT78526.1 Chorismate mutase I [Streptococcus sp. DD13]
MNLEEIRQEIDQVDRSIVQLLEKRMDLVTQVTAYKKETGKAVLDKDREMQLLQKVAKNVQNPVYEATILATYQDIMKHSRAFQSERLQSQEESL